MAHVRHWLLNLEKKHMFKYPFVFEIQSSNVKKISCITNTILCVCVVVFVVPIPSIYFAGGLTPCSKYTETEL